MRWCIPMAFLFLSVPVVEAHGAHASPTPAAGWASITPASPEEVFSRMQHTFRADRARGQHLRYQFDFSDPQSGQWWIEIHDGAYSIGRGKVDRPDVIFSCSGADWVRLSNGTLGGIQAYLSGRLRVSGNQFTAHKLDELFP